MRTTRRSWMAGCSLTAVLGLLLGMVPISQSAYAAPTSFTCEGTVTHLSPQDIPGGTYSYALAGFRAFDGASANFGDTSLQATSSSVAAWARKLSLIK